MDIRIGGNVLYNLSAAFRAYRILCFDIQRISSKYTLLGELFGGYSHLHPSFAIGLHSFLSSDRKAMHGSYLASKIDKVGSIYKIGSMRAA
jgi:hypothetical protein